MGDDAVAVGRMDHGGNAAVEGVRVHRDNRPVVEIHRRGEEDSPAAAHGTDRRSRCHGANGAKVGGVETTVDCRNDRSGTIDAALDCASGNDRDRGGPAEAVKVSRKDCGRDDGCCVRASASDRGRDRSREEERVVRDRRWWGRRKT